MKRFATIMFAVSALAVITLPCARAADSHPAISAANDVALTAPPDAIASESAYWQ
jgi:hypothetical protein